MVSLDLIRHKDDFNIRMSLIPLCVDRLSHERKSKELLVAILRHAPENWLSEPFTYASHPNRTHRCCAIIKQFPCLRSPIDEGIKHHYDRLRPLRFEKSLCIR